MKNIIEIALGFGFALIFGIGLAICGMLDPKNVIGFLDVTGDWKPALAFVMGAAIIVAAPFFWLGKKRIATNAPPIFGEKFDAPPTKPDAKLVIGAAIFGIGWSLVGICPGPAIVLLGIAPTKIMPFLFAAAIGAGVSDFLVKRPKV